MDAADPTGLPVDKGNVTTQVQRPTSFPLDKLRCECISNHKSWQCDKSQNRKKTAYDEQLRITMLVQSFSKRLQDKDCLKTVWKAKVSYAPKLSTGPEVIDLGVCKEVGCNEFLSVVR